MSAIRCSACNGSKKVLGFGLMLKDCDRCNATGYEIPAESQATQAIQEVSDDSSNKKQATIVVKKRGRPARKV